MRTIQQAADNLAASIPNIPTRYKMGVQNADWAGPASSDAAEAAWAQGVNAAAQAKRRQAGIRAAGNTRWQQGAMNKGAAAIGPQIQAGLTRYQQNFGPVLAAMQQARTTLPPRSPDMMTNITNRLVPIAKAAQGAGKKAKRV